MVCRNGPSASGSFVLPNCVKSKPTDVASALNASDPATIGGVSVGPWWNWCEGVGGAKPIARASCRWPNGNIGVSRSRSELFLG